MKLLKYGFRHKIYENNTNPYAITKTFRVTLVSKNWVHESIVGPEKPAKKTRMSNIVLCNSYGFNEIHEMHLAYSGT